MGSCRNRYSLYLFVRAKTQNAKGSNTLGTANYIYLIESG